MSPYQKRMRVFVWWGRAYFFAGLIAIAYFKGDLVAWLVYVSTVVLHQSLAVGCDAIYDSLREKSI